jgi:ubiquinone/menaquinone biosynthesis C-methylase UbiE
MTDFDKKAGAWDSDPTRVERANAVADAIRATTRLTPDMTALEYGCGTGLLSFALHNRIGRITLADSSRGMLDVLAEKIAVAQIRTMTPLKLDLTVDPLPDERFDLIYTLMTMHHVPDIARMLGNFFALLKTPGVLCVSDLDAEDGSFHGPEFPGHKGFDRAELKRIAGEAGFPETSFTTAFHIFRQTGGKRKDFPLFLMIARKTSAENG